MYKRSAITSFKSYKQDELAPLSRHIIETMGNNPSIFATPVPSLEDIKKLVDAYSAILDKSEYVGRTGDIHAARRSLETGLKALGQYVNRVALGDESKLEKSGFPLSKPRSHQGIIPEAKEAEVTIDSSGYFHFTAKPPVSGYWGVIFACTLKDNPIDDPQQWAWQYSPKPSVIFTRGVERGKEYKFAVAFIGDSGELRWYHLGKTLFANR